MALVPKAGAPLVPEVEGRPLPAPIHETEGEASGRVGGTAQQAVPEAALCHVRLRRVDGGRRMRPARQLNRALGQRPRTTLCRSSWPLSIERETRRPDEGILATGGAGHTMGALATRRPQGNTVSEYRNKEVSLAFDLCGCPNRCRHCWLGRACRSRIDLTEAVDVFRRAGDHVKDGRQRPHLERIRFFASHFREPHYCPNYKDIREKELELNAGVDYAASWELLSVWRLAREPEYAKWAYGIGKRKCQIALFGVGATNDWGYRRGGAHADIVTATRRLMEVGILPRWQVFLTKKGLPELGAVLRLVDELKIQERLSGIGLEFELLLNDMTPVGEARRLEHLRLTPDDVKLIPPELVDATERYTKKPFVLKSEAQWIQEILGRPDEPLGMDYPPDLWLFVTPGWQVFPNIGSLEPWWSLGTYGDGDITEAFATFVADRPAAMKAGTTLRLHDTVLRCGDRHSNRLYGSESDLRWLWLERHCETHA